MDGGVAVEVTPQPAQELLIIALVVLGRRVQRARRQLGQFPGQQPAYLRFEHAELGVGRVCGCGAGAQRRVRLLLNLGMAVGADEAHHGGVRRGRVG